MPKTKKYAFSTVLKTSYLEIMQSKDLEKIGQEVSGKLERVINNIAKKITP